MSLLFFFLDGIGIGPAAPHNPLSRATGLFALSHASLAGNGITGLPAGWEGCALDATLDVPGLPQSATGQTTLFTGVNAARHLGHHQSALPGPTLRRLLVSKSLMRTLTLDGFGVAFANAFRPNSAGALDGPLPRRVSASTIAVWAAGVRFRTIADVRRGVAVFHDVTGAGLRALDPTLAEGSPEDAGDALVRLLEEAPFVLFEHFETDLIGHGRIERDAVAHLGMLDALVSRVTASLDPNRDGILVVSDHGNLEDTSTTGHTRNPVPLLLWGSAREIRSRAPLTLMDVAPAVRHVLAVGGVC